MKRVPVLMLLIMAFVSFATMDSFADSSPPGVEISISYELPQGIDVNFEIQVAQAWQSIQMNSEGRIAVYDCDLKCWPGVDESNYYNLNTIARETSMYDDALNRAIMFEKSLYTKNPYEISTSIKTQHRVFVDKNEVLSMFEHSNLFVIV